MKKTFFSALLLAFPGLLLAKDVTLLSDLQTTVDAVPAIRQSLGLRWARAVDATTLEAEFGLSLTDTAAENGAYRIISFDDPNYAYEKFVRPVSAKMEKIKECQGVPGAMQESFYKTRVRLELPYALQKGSEYHLLAQGTGQTMITATRCAAAFSYPSAPNTRDPEIDTAVIGLRRASPIGNGILMLEFGPGLSSDFATELGSYKVQVNGSPVSVKNMGWRRMVETYLPIGWPYKSIPRHEIFLTLENPFKNGDIITIDVSPEICGGRLKTQLTFSDAKSYSPSIKVNQVGYLTDSPVKIAYLGRWLGEYPIGGGGVDGAVADQSDAFWGALTGGPAPEEEASGPALSFKEPPAFSICRSADATEAFTGTTRLIHTSGSKDEGVHKVDHSGENVYELDFTAFKEPGKYFVSIAGVGRSPDFEIGPNIYKKVFDVQSYGVFAQRCGIELKPPFSEWHRIACHNKGVTPTTMSRHEGEHGAFIELPAHVDYSLQEGFQLPAELLALNRDPDLLAYWPLNGDLLDASGNGNDLKPINPTPYYKDAPEVMPDHNKALGPTLVMGENGAEAAPLALNRESGMSMSFWLRFTDGIKFNGVLIGHEEGNINNSRFQISSGWGFLRGCIGSRGVPLEIGRFQDKIWHHLAMVFDPKRGDDGLLVLYVDGKEKNAVPPGANPIELLPFRVAGINGEEAGGKYLDEIRVYDRPLTEKEIIVLATRWGDQAIALKTYGGHHDAGDYNPRSHIEVAQTLMTAYEMAPNKFYDGQLNIPEAGNGTPDIIDEANWALRLWPAMQTPDGSVRGGTESNGDPNFIQSVDLDIKGDYAFAPDEQTSLIFAGTFAQASRIAKKLGKKNQAETMLNMAQKAYDWGSENPPKEKLTPGKYSERYISPRAYAATQLLHTTGEERYHKDALKFLVWTQKPDAELDMHNLYDQNAAAWAYLQCPKEMTDFKIREHIKAAIKRRADEFIQLCDTMAYKFMRHPWAPITWGTGAYQNTLDPIMWAYQITGDEVYREWMVRTCDNTLGANPLGVSYITGLGERTVRAPLHNSRYSHFGEVVKGMQVQGPNERGEGYGVKDTAHPRLQTDFASLYTFVDNHFAIAMDEGTMVNMVRSMAAFGLMLPDHKGSAPVEYNYKSKPEPKPDSVSDSEPDSDSESDSNSDSDESIE